MTMPTEPMTLEERAEQLAREMVAGLVVPGTPFTSHDVIAQSICAALEAAVAQRDREWTKKLWPELNSAETPANARPYKDTNHDAAFYAVEQERAALRKIV